MYVINLYAGNTHTKCQSNIFIFDGTMVKKPGKCDDVTYLKFNFGISVMRKINIFGILGQKWIA